MERPDCLIASMYHAKFSDDDKGQQHYASSGRYSSQKYHMEEPFSHSEEKNYDYQPRGPESAARDSNPDDEKEGIAFTAARQVFNESKLGDHKPENKKVPSGIENAIRKAIQEEKNLLSTGN